MKKIDVILLLGLVFISSCDRGVVESRTYILNNSSNREIDIYFYKSHVLKESKNIVGMGEITRKITDNGHGGTLAPWSAFNADSIIVTYDKSRISTHCICLNRLPDSQNIFFVESYIVNGDMYSRSFTEEDYNNAQEIDGG